MCSLARALSAHTHKVWMLMKTLTKRYFFGLLGYVLMSVTSTIETVFDVKVIKQGYQYYKLYIAVSTVNFRHSEFIVKYNVI